MVGLGPGRLDQERTLADLTPDDALGFEVLEGLDHRDQGEIANFTISRSATDLVADLDARLSSSAGNNMS